MSRPPRTRPRAPPRVIRPPQDRFSGTADLPLWGFTDDPDNRADGGRKWPPNRAMGTQEAPQDRSDGAGRRKSATGGDTAATPSDEARCFAHQSGWTGMRSNSRADARPTFHDRPIQLVVLAGGMVVGVDWPSSGRGRPVWSRRGSEGRADRLEMVVELRMARRRLVEAQQCANHHGGVVQIEEQPVAHAAPAQEQRPLAVGGQLT